MNVFIVDKNKIVLLNIVYSYQVSNSGGLYISVWNRQSIILIYSENVYAVENHVSYACDSDVSMCIFSDSGEVSEFYTL